MRSLLSSLTLLALSAPAFAAPTPLPEPESIALLAVAGIAAVVALRRKK